MTNVTMYILYYISNVERPVVVWGIDFVGKLLGEFRYYYGIGNIRGLGGRFSITTNGQSKEYLNTV